MSVFDTIRDKLFGGEPKEKLENVQDQSQDELDLAAYVKNKVEEVRAMANRISHEGIWMTNIAYLLGFDSVFYDPSLKQYRPIANNTQALKRNRIHENLVLPAVQNRLARMLKNPPRYDVRPKSMEVEDKEACKIALELLNEVWDKQSINRKRIDLGMWLQECGHAYLGVCWDDQLGDDLVAPTTGENQGPMGDMRIDVVSALEGFPDPLAKSWEDLSYFIRAKVRRLDYFRMHFPERGQLVKEEGAWLLSAQYELRINSLNSVGASSSGTAEQMKNAAIELSYYEKKSPKYPNGRHIIVANGVVLKNDELPVGEIPYAKFDDVVVGGKYYSESLITHGRPLQDQYNVALAKRAEWVRKLLAGKYIAAKGHGLIQESLHNQSGEVVEYDPVPGAEEPHALQLPVIPAYAYQETTDLKKSFYDNFGLSEVSRGQLPSASIPAVGIQMLLEQDETRMGIEVEQHEYSWARVGQLILKYADKYYIMPRKLKTRGANLQYEVKEVDGEMLRKNFDVIVIRGSTLPNNKIIKRQEILNAFQQGLLGNPQDPAILEKVLGLLEYGEVGEVWRDYHLDMTQIQSTIEQIEQEIAPPVNKYDNHAMHIVEKNRYRKSDKYDLLSPFAQQLLQQDMDAHALQGAGLKNPAILQPPDNGPPPDQVLAQLHQRAAQMGLPVDNSVHPAQNNMGAPPNAA